MKGGAWIMKFDDRDIFDDYEEYRESIDYDWVDSEIEKLRIQHEDSKHNVHRDNRGRLNKGALLASKDSCNEMSILLRHKIGMSVKQIVDCMGCSKSTVYNIISKHKNSEG